MARIELTTDDPNVVGLDVTTHDDYDAMIGHIRATCDPGGNYADEGSGSIQNLLSLEGYRFGYREIP